MKNAKWIGFEQKVAELFRLAGYKVETNVLIHGGQTDSLVTDCSGLSKTKILIECKYSDTDNSVSVDDVENFVSRTIGLRHKGVIDQGYLVTNTKFTAPGKSHAEEHSYASLFTINELYRKIFSFEYYLRSISDKNKAIMRPFISPTYKNYPSYKVISEPEKDLINYLTDWTATKNTKIDKICILGDYGAGKTTLANRIASTLADNYLEGNSDCLIPIVFPLHKFYKAFDLKSMITDFIVNDCMISNFRYETFLGLLEIGIFLIIFDGFDEMARNVDQEIRYSTLYEIGKIAKSSSKVILTGRQSYFPTEEELHEVLSSTQETDDIYCMAKSALNEVVNYSLLEIQPFSREQINCYLKASISDISQLSIISDLISNTYAFFEIATRPVLLDMIVKTLPEILKFNDKSKIQPAKLYEIYTDRWIKREEEKGDVRKLIRKVDKLKFVENLSLFLYSSDKLSISNDELIDLIKSDFDIKDRKDIDYFEHDIRTCSFLSRDRNEFKFIHLTFYEYFLAKKIIEKLSNNERIGRTLPIQVVRFASEILNTCNENIKLNITSLAENNIRTLDGQNAFWIILNSNVSMSNKMVINTGFTQSFINSYIDYLKTQNISEEFSSHISDLINSNVNSQNISMRNKFNGSYFDLDDLKSDLYFTVLSTLSKNKICSEEDLIHIVKGCISSVSTFKSTDMKIMTSSLSDYSSDFFIDENVNIENIIIDRELEATLNELVDRLPNMQRMVVSMHYSRNMTISEISSIYKIPSRNITKTLQVAHRNLKELLENEKSIKNFENN